MFMGTVQAQLCTRGFLCETGATIRLTGGEVVACITAGVEVGSTGTVEMYGVSISSSIALDINLTSATASFFGAGNKIRSDLVGLVSGATFVGVSVSETPSDTSVTIRGELHVGTVDEPSETALGGGDSHTQGMTVLRTSDDIAFTDITSFVLFPADSSTAIAFNSTAVGERLYIGGSFARFSGLKKTLTVAASPTATLSQVSWEFWNGALWTSFETMSTDSDFPYTPHGCEAFRLNGSQFRFAPLPGWVTTTIDGVVSFWVRATIAGSPLVTNPVLDQIKLQTNHTEINQDGFIEFFG